MLAPTAPWPANSGTRIRQSNLIQALARRHEVTLLYFQDEPDRADEAEAALRRWQVRGVPVDHRTKQRCSGNPFTGAWTEPWLLRGEYSPAFDETVRDALRTNAPDLVVVSRLILLRYVIGLVEPERLVLDLDDLESLKISRQMGMEPWGVRRLKGYLEGWRVNRLESQARTFALTTVCSEQDASRLRGRGWEGELAVVPNGVDTRRLRPLPEAPDQPPTVLFCGLLSYRPNRDGLNWFLRRIWPLIRREIPGTRLLIVGRRPPPDLLAWDGLGGIRVEGEVASVEPFYARAYLSVVPIRFGSGTRIKILESFAFGRPVVSTTMGAEGIPVCDGSDILLADDPEGFSQACVRLLKDLQERCSLAAAGRRLVELRYDWSRIGEDWRRLVEQAGRLEVAQ